MPSKTVISKEVKAERDKLLRQLDKILQDPDARDRAETLHKKISKLPRRLFGWGEQP